MGLDLALLTLVFLQRCGGHTNLLFPSLCLFGGFERRPSLPLRGFREEILTILNHTGTRGDIAEAAFEPGAHSFVR
jgi:hypothetical protein